jgi:putative ABC transport system ATP-binding protein
VTTPEDPEMALARGAALAAVNAPLLASSTAALAQAVGTAANYARTVVLHVAPDTATSAVVSTADGSVAEVRRRFLPDDDDEALSALVEMIKGADAMGSGPAGPEGIVVVGLGVGVQVIKPALEAATSLPVSALEMPLTKDGTPAPVDAPLLAPSNTAVTYPHERDVVDVKPHLRGELYGAAVLEASNLCKSFGRGVTVTPILKNINLRIFPGEFVALIGPSGSGKSTLLSILGLLEPPTSGDVLINQKSVAQLSPQELAGVRGHRIGYVFQSFNLLTGLSVAENVMLPSMLSGESGRAQYDRAMTLLDQFGLAGLAKRVPAELSGGEQQRVAIARALFMTPDVILADEPTGNLDTTNGRKVIDALYRLNSAGQTIVLVTHDRSIANETPRLVSLLDGRIETDTSPIQASGNATWRTGH